MNGKELWKKVKGPLLVGSVVVVGTPYVTSALVKLTEMVGYSGTTVMSVLLPHTLIAAGALAFVANLVENKYL